MMNGPQLVITAAPQPVPVRAAGDKTQPGQAIVPAGIPDVVVAVNQSMVRVFAVFDIDPVTQEMKVSVVDDQGHLVRLIPADSVAQMLRAMAAYPRR